MAAQMVSYHCTHCGRNFEAEEKEILECPGCFWSTSVKRAEDIQAEEALNVLPPKKSGWAIPWADLFRAAGIVLLILAVVAVIFGVVIPFVQKQQGVLQKAREKGIAISVKDEQGLSGSTPPAQVSLLTSGEQETLSRKLEISHNRVPTGDEKGILDKGVELKTGSVQKLPSQIFTEESFKKLLEDQQAFYKVTLPRSYRNKLTDLFEEKYVPAGEAFNAGDLLKARDLWVEALVFPMYGDDIVRHRGVVLTMLRPYINDTLAKIGAINNSLVVGKIRAMEQNISEAYAAYLQTVSVKAWAEALAEQTGIEKMMDQLEQLQKSIAAAPPYPAAIGQIDQGIQAALMDILNLSSPSVLNLTPLREDLQEKKKVIESFIPENYEPQKNLYDEAMKLIAEKQWQDAAERLKRIEFPPALVRDAEEKLQVLSKLSQGEAVLPGAETKQEKTGRVSP